MANPKDQITVQTTSTEPENTLSPLLSPKQNASVVVTAAEGEPEASGSGSGDGGEGGPPAAGDQVDEQKKGFLAYFKTKEFYITLLLGQILAITNTSTSTFTTLLNLEGTSIPAFQTFFNYVLLTLIFTPYTIYRYGFKRWLRLVWYDGWKYIILAFCDVEGNYFIVLAYQYTTMMSASLINFWAIAVVVIVSFLFLRVRYHMTQIVGILICIGGMGVLIASDHITGGEGAASDELKGDLFALLGATFYGLTNTFEEYFVSKRPMYEVLGQMSLYALIINGAQAGIFDRDSFRTAHWNSKVGGYLTGYTLCLTLFYCLAPLLFRLASAAFFNISMLTMNFWSVCIGIKVFHYTVHWMYPIAFVLIIVGQLIYFLGRRVLAEARKPWLGEDQERGVDGLFTARRKIGASVERGVVAGSGSGSTGEDQGQGREEGERRDPSIV
ncbi:DUF914 domain membrane protein [Aspergillus glaucus CBS 516.65]|uniref:EamA domain-containing protein n=1 Tax=Aspergillus glaucus CBS 516.65 TaxID=1160497 RepID=A0A1L9V8P4_ASPGL|nr:hypothetical protein ASPGLDRAFT_39266 [Aspergillus glaucus CBS 516.65]OJJ80271.1 hypothetical protein ASPGLDRAFT_39266 [Aspergillus glaucus CBS 516.65]